MLSGVVLEQKQLLQVHNNAKHLKSIVHKKCDYLAAFLPEHKVYFILLLKDLH